MEVQVKGQGDLGVLVTDGSGTIAVMRSPSSAFFCPRAQRWLRVWRGSGATGGYRCARGLFFPLAELSRSVRGSDVETGFSQQFRCPGSDTG